MRRWLVIFSSHPTPPVDQVVVDVWSPTMLAAIAEAKREIGGVMGQWAKVEAAPWPRGVRSANDVAKKLAAAAAS